MVTIIKKQNMVKSIFEAINTRNFDGLQQFINDDVASDFRDAWRIEGYKK